MPNGARWTLRLLADQMVQLGYIESKCHETVRQTLQKTNFSLGNKIDSSPEKMLSLFARWNQCCVQQRYHPDFPVVCRLMKLPNNLSKKLLSQLP